MNTQHFFRGEKIRNLPFIIVLGFLLCLSSCQQEGKSEPSEIDQVIDTKINVEEISNRTGITFDVLKTSDVGSKPIYKFFWICFESDLSQEKIEFLAESIINDILTRKPGTYHAFQIHFFRKCDVKEILEDSKVIATACYLPEGDWTKVGRIPIEDYAEYRLICTMAENEN